MAPNESGSKEKIRHFNELFEDRFKGVAGPDQETTNRIFRTKEKVKSFIAIIVIVLFVGLIGCSAAWPDRFNIKDLMPYITGVIVIILGYYFHEHERKK